MKQYLPVHLDRLRDGHTEAIDAVLPSEIIQLPKGDELLFDSPIHVQGEAYLTDRYLILDLTMTTEVELPCSFCNARYRKPIEVHHYIHEEPIEELRARMFEAASIIQGALLLEVPLNPLCGGTVCLHRDEVEPYLK